MTDEQKIALKQRAFDWLIQQGSSTVILSAILAFGGYAVVNVVPAHIAALNAGRKAETEILAEHHSKDVAALVRAIEQITVAFQDDQERDEQRYRDLLQRFMQREHALNGPTGPLPIEN